MNLEQMVDTFAKLRPSATFVSVKEYLNSYHELSDFGIVFHIDYEAALKRSYEIVSGFKAEDILTREAKRLVLSSLTGRIDAYKTPLEERDNPYVYFKDIDGNYIKGIKAHEDTNDLFMFGFVVSKKILVPAEYKHTNSAPLTIAREKIESLTPVSKFRQFRLIPKSYRTITVENLQIG